MNPSIGRITHQEGACMPDNRLVKIEVQVKHLTDAVQEVKADVREFRSEFRNDLNELRTDACNTFASVMKWYPELKGGLLVTCLPRNRWPSMTLRCATSRSRCRWR